MRTHRSTKITALLLALVLCLVCMPMAAFADEIYGPPTAAVDVRSIPGIDYNRITYKATGGTKAHPVELKLGDLTFNGELAGSHGLDIEELNEIINAVLKEKGLTAERVALISRLAAQVEDDAAVYWLDQVIEGALSYIPSIPGTGVGVNDLWAYVVHGEVKDIGNVQKDKMLDSVVNEAEEAINTALSNSANKVGGLIGRIDKATNAAMGATSGTKIGFGAIINTAKVAKEWMEGSKRFEKYLKDLEKALADVNGFYSECSRRAEKAAADKEGDNAWVIRFDKSKNYRTYNATFWGISGVMMQAELSGVLEKVGNNNDVTGEYKGTLWLDIEAVDMENSFDDKFSKTGTFKVMLDSLKAKQISGQAQDVYAETVLEMQTQTDVSVTVKGAGGTQTADVSGKFTANSDDIVFKFDHNFLLDVSAPLPQHGGITIHEYGSYHFTSSDLTKLTQVTTYYTEETGLNGNSITGSKTPSAPDVGPAPGDVGTVWKPLESKPAITIYFGK